MSATLTFSGLSELKAELLKLPANLASGAAGVLVDEANQAAATVRAEYERHRTKRSAASKNLSKHLADGVSVTTVSSPNGVRVTVKSSSQIAYLFDNGSEARHYFTVNGVQHYTGEMGSRTPPTHIFAGTMSRTRRKMYERLATLLQTYGLTVIRDG